MTTQQELEQKRLEARAALEGPEWLAKHEQAEKEKKWAEEKTRLESQLAEITDNKERLELDWVRLDDERKNILHRLTPLTAREKEIEDAEAKLELEEARAVQPQEKEALEQKRWTIQQSRHEAEAQKWQLQDQLWKLEAEIDKLTPAYRKLLSQEEELQKALAAGAPLPKPKTESGPVSPLPNRQPRDRGASAPVREGAEKTEQKSSPSPPDQPSIGYA